MWMGISKGFYNNLSQQLNTFLVFTFDIYEKMNKYVLYETRNQHLQATQLCSVV